MIFELTVEGLVCNDNTTQSLDSVEVSFILPHSWDDLAKVAVFKQSGTLYRVSLVEDKCLMPDAIDQASPVSVGVYGIQSTRWADSVTATVEGN